MAQTPKERSQIKKARKVKQGDRSLRACTRCRQRKQKCDNALPHCGNCVKGNVACEAFHLNVASHENMLRLYDQLQESEQERSVLLKQLQTTQGDPQGTLAAVVSGFVSLGKEKTASSENTHLKCVTSWTCLAHRLRLERAQLSLHVDNGTKQLAQAFCTGAEKVVCLHRVMDFVSTAYPALAPALGAVLQFSEKADMPAVIRDVLDFLVGKTAEQGPQDDPKSEPCIYQTYRLARGIFEAEPALRITSLLLLALMALMTFRLSDLIQLESQIAFYVCTYVQNVTEHSTNSLNLLQVCHWLHVHTACLTGMTALPFDRPLPHVPQQSWPNSTDSCALALLHYRQTLLEYETKQAVASLSLTERQSPCTPPNNSLRNVWKVLTALAELAETIELKSERSEPSAVPVDRPAEVLLQYKLLIRVYSVFPTSLYMDDPTHRCYASCSSSAIPMAAQALRLYYACSSQYGWLGDSILDAQQFVDLVCSFAFLMRKGRQDVLSVYELGALVQITSEVGDCIMTRWSISSVCLQIAIAHLKSCYEACFQGQSSTEEPAWQAGVWHSPVAQVDPQLTVFQPSSSEPQTNGSSTETDMIPWTGPSSSAPSSEPGSLAPPANILTEAWLGHKNASMFLFTRESSADM